MRYSGLVSIMVLAVGTQACALHKKPPTAAVPADAAAGVDQKAAAAAPGTPATASAGVGSAGNPGAGIIMPSVSPVPIPSVTPSPSGTPTPLVEPATLTGGLTPASPVSPTPTPVMPSDGVVSVPGTNDTVAVPGQPVVPAAATDLCSEADLNKEKDGLVTAMGLNDLSHTLDRVLKAVGQTTDANKVNASSQINALSIAGPNGPGLVKITDEEDVASQVKNKEVKAKIYKILDPILKTMNDNKPAGEPTVIRKGWSDYAKLHHTALTINAYTYMPKSAIVLREWNADPSQYGQTADAGKMGRTVTDVGLYFLGMDLGYRIAVRDVGAAAPYYRKAVDKKGAPFDKVTMAATPAWDLKFYPTLFEYASAKLGCKTAPTGMKMDEYNSLKPDLGSTATPPAADATPPAATTAPATSSANPPAADAGLVN